MFSSDCQSSLHPSELDYFDIEALPEELTYEVFKFFNAHTLVVCSQVNHRWYELCNDNALWKHLVTKSWKEKKKNARGATNWRYVGDSEFGTVKAKKRRDWKQFYRWCESENIRWKCLQDYETDAKVAQQSKSLGERLLQKGNPSAAKKAYEHSRRLIPDEEVDAILNSWSAS